MANNSLVVVPQDGIITPQPVWEVRETLHDATLEHHPNFIEGPSSKVSMEELGATDKPCGEGVRMLTQNCC